MEAIQPQWSFRPTAFCGVIGDYIRIIHFIISIDGRLSRTVAGIHFYFVGENGARATADAVELLEDQVHSLKEDVSAILNVKIE